MNAKLMSHLNRALLVAAALLGAATFAGAQTTNWIAYNDHRPSTTPVANGWKITAPNVTGYNMGAPADLPPSPLTDFRTGGPLAATVSFTRTAAPDDFGTVGRPIRTNTPMARIFYGICDLSNDGLVGVRGLPQNATESFVTIGFAGLDPSKRYVFRGSVARNGGYGNRWSLAAIAADGWTDAHINGDGGPGILTVNDFPASNLNLGEAAWNSGANNEGAVIGWNDIAPFPDGTFTITCKQYTGAIPGGTTATGPYGYAFGAMMLAEVEIVAPTITGNPPASTTVEQNRSFSLNVDATGAPLNYQWYKEGLGAIPGATFPTYSVAQAQVPDSGMYYAVVYNSLNSQTSTVAQVTVFADTTAPTVDTIFSYPTVDATGVATLDQIIIEFNEPVTPASVSSPSLYTVPGGGNPVSVIVTNGRSVVLVLGTPMAEDTDYSVTLRGATDAVGNMAGTSMASFHSWVSGIGNGLLMESYNVEDAANTVESLLADPDYPNNPFRRDTLRAFDSRLIFDDTQAGYGVRIRGVFIPPVSGDWAFFARTRQLGVLNLNPNGTDEAGKVEILRQSTENAPYNWDRLTSSLFPLRAGKAYYIEGLYKGAVAPAFLKVAARLAGTGVPMPVDSPDTEVDPNSLAGAPIAFPLAPRNLGGALTLVQDVHNVTAEENHLGTFAVQVSDPSGLPIFYQWFRDGAAIPGANGPSYTLRATAADDGASFRVQIAKIGATINSQSATLSVIADTTGPVLLKIAGDDTFGRIFLTWNEDMFVDPAQETGSYQILGPNMTEIPVTLATLVNGSNVVLTLADRLQPNTTYTVEMAFQADAAGNPTLKVGNPAIDTEHGVVANLQSFVITPGLTHFQAYLGLPTGGTLDEFVASAVYPDGATFGFYTNVLNWPQSVPNFDQYAMRFTGLFVAPESGIHRFDPAHDDDARLRIYASDDPNDTFMELTEAGTSMFDADLTLDVDMVAGHRYYYEFIVRELAGADYAGLEVTLPSGGVSVPIAAQYLEAATEPQSSNPMSPQITAYRNNGNLVITWPGSFTTFVLETAPTIPSATWTPVSSMVVNGQNTATIPIPASGNAFFRLRQ